MHYAYILESSPHPETYCRDHTSNFKQRLAEHNAGKCTHNNPWAPGYFQWNGYLVPQIAKG